MTAGIDIALARIAEEAVAKTGTLDLSNLHLSRLPDELSKLSHLKILNCFCTEVNDLTPLVDLRSLQTLRCYDSKVSDLRPLAGLKDLQTLDCPVTLVSDLSPLAELRNLQILICINTAVNDLTPLADLRGLKILDCSFIRVGDLTPLNQLKGLTHLNCSGTEIDDLTPLSDLTSLEFFNCSDTSVSDLAPLSDLRDLNHLNCSATNVNDLTPLSDLASVVYLNCSHTRVGDLTPLIQLRRLTHLDCFGTEVADLTPLSDLTSLTFLSCSFTRVGDLTPLSQLKDLTRLNCSGTEIDDLTPLTDLDGLKEFDCSSTWVSDLKPLADLGSLEGLAIRHCAIDDWPQDFWGKESLKTVEATDAELAGIPADIFTAEWNVLPREWGKNCLPAIRAHLDDLGNAPERLTDVKLILLGNGRIGKTQIVNRLRGEPFEKDADSTHGVSLVQAPIPGSVEDNFNIWDFGGQDIYFGTHMLFLKSRAVFMLVWTPEADDAESHEHGGMTFRNQPVAWWLNCIRRFGNAGSPLVIVQNQLDRDGDRGDHPALVDGRDECKWCRSVAYSAATDEGRGALDDHLKHAAKRFNPPLIGKGRLSVLRELQRRREEDRERASKDKRHRTLSYEAFVTLCEETGGISDPVQFLHFLHNAGQIFWREGLFQNRVILDQAWVLNAVYSVFDRKKCLDFFKRHHGRFTRSDLDMLIWKEQGFSRDEQELFLSFMQSCGICFVLRRGSDDVETVYIAPDHLPEDWEPEARQERWGTASPDAELSFGYESLPPALMRNLIGRIGGKAGLSCDYWRNGFYGYESRTDARVLVEQEIDDRWKGSIRLQARGGRSHELVAEMEKALIDEERRLGLSSERQGTERPIKGADREEALAGGEKPKLDFVPEPRDERSYYVSYAWEDDRSEVGKTRAEIVDQFCTRARAQGIVVNRDKDVMKLGDRISTFMKRIARGDRVIVVLSDKYLRSPFCMYELYEIWLQARGEDERFLKRIRVYTQEDAKIWSISDRLQRASYWNEEYKKHASIDGEELLLLGAKDLQSIKFMRQFASHVGEILTVVTDILQPRTLDDLVSYTFDGDDFDD